MPKFEKQYVHFMWNDELKGKKVFIGRTIKHLQDCVKENRKGFYDVINEGSSEFPFYDGHTNWMFVYYDPWYELKLAYEQGKKIQFRDNENYEWQDIKTPNWRGGTEYRIKPEEEKQVIKLATKRELSMWLAKGNGEWKKDSDDYIRSFTDCIYNVNKDWEPVADDVIIRKWEDTKWHKPTREYMGLE